MTITKIICWRVVTTCIPASTDRSKATFLWIHTRSYSISKHSQTFEAALLIFTSRCVKYSSLFCKSSFPWVSLLWLVISFKFDENIPSPARKYRAHYIIPVFKRIKNELEIWLLMLKLFPTSSSVSYHCRLQIFGCIYVSVKYNVIAQLSFKLSKSSLHTESRYQ